MAVLGVYSGASQEVAKMMYGVNFECMVTSGVTRDGSNPKFQGNFWILGTRPMISGFDDGHLRIARYRPRPWWSQERRKTHDGC